MIKKRLQIGVFTDLRFTSLEAPTGVTKHIVEMTRGLSHYDDVDLIVLAAQDQLDDRGNIPAGNALANFPVRKLPLSWHRAYLLWLLTGRPYMDRYARDLDWVYCPKNDFIPFKDVETAFTVHGAHEIDPSYPQEQSVRQRIAQARSRLCYRRICQQSSKIFTVSSFLKQQMVDWFKADADKIVVIGNGVEDVYFNDSNASLIKQNKQLLSVGGLNVLDGGDRIIRLAQFMQEKKSDYTIVVAGNQHEEELLNLAKNAQNITLKGYVPASELSVLMRSSQALLFLTRYETFGIAAIEAMASRIPVITCDNTAVPEIVGNSALYTEPDDVDTIYADIRKLEEPDVRDGFVAKGLQKSFNYRWKDCVARLKNAFDEG